MLKCMDQILKMDSHFAPAWKAKGDYYFSIKEHDRALDCYQNAQLFTPKDREIWLKKALVFEEKEMFDDAMQCLEKCSAARDLQIQYLFAKGRMLQKQNLFSEALQCFEDVLKKNPECQQAKAQCLYIQSVLNPSVATK